MSSINPHFTLNYSQPEEYQFSHDSVFLARRVFDLEKRNLNADYEILDLCSGCGIVGLDFLIHCKNEINLSVKKIDFLEIQSVYQSHFNKNIQNLKNIGTSLTYLAQNYSSICDSSHDVHTYDLILCNPPYFLPDQGKLSPSDFKNRCRFYLDSSFESLVFAVHKSLKPDGRAYVLVRSLSDHGKDHYAQLERTLGKKAVAERVCEIRGTDLIRITPINR